MTSLRAILCATLLGFVALTPASAQEAARNVLPMPEPPFKGTIGLTPADSVKDFPAGGHSAQRARRTSSSS